MNRLFPRLEQFWILQLAGWAVYSGGVLIGLLPHFLTYEIAYDLTILSGMFAASFILRGVCRRSVRRGTAWPRTMLLAVLASIVFAVPCSILAVWASYSVQNESRGWAALLVWLWCATLYATIVLTSWSGVYLGIKHYQLFRSEQAHSQQAEELVRSAKLQALRFQLQPHFLFNTLNAISTLILEGRSAEASLMLGKLANFLRGTVIDSNGAEIPLSQEVSNLQEYLTIEKARLGDRLKVNYSIDSDAECAMVPALLLQPLTENAIYHGIAPRPDGGTVRIEGERAGEQLRLRVCDNGIGRATTRRGVGLRNTIERLRVLYGADQRLAVCWPDEGGCVVEIELPYRPGAAVRNGELACVS